MVVSRSGPPLPPQLNLRPITPLDSDTNHIITYWLIQPWFVVSVSNVSPRSLKPKITQPSLRENKREV